MSRLRKWFIGIAVLLFTLAVLGAVFQAFYQTVQTTNRQNAISNSTHSIVKDIKTLELSNNANSQTRLRLSKDIEALLTHDKQSAAASASTAAQAAVKEAALVKTAESILQQDISHIIATDAVNRRLICEIAVASKVPGIIKDTACQGG